MSLQRSTRLSGGSNKRSSLSLHNETYSDDDDGETEPGEESRSDSKRRRLSQPGRREASNEEEEEKEEEEEQGGFIAPQRSHHHNSYSHSQPAPAAHSRPEPAADAGDDEIEFSYEGEETASQGSQQQQPVARSNSSAQHSAPAASAPIADVELPAANLKWLRDHAVMQEQLNERSGRPLSAQNRQHRTQLRQIYDEVTSQVRVIQTDQLTEPETIKRGVAMANALHERVSHVTEEIQDAEAMRVLAGKGHDKAKQLLQHDDLINVEQMIRALHERFGLPEGKEDSGGIDWVRMGEQTMRLSLNAPVTSFMRGVINQQLAHKERKKSQRRQRDDDLVSSSATTLDSAEQLVDKQTHMRQLHVLRHFKRLTRNGMRAVWLYELLVDPHSFVRTVENFFDFSFLVKDNVRMEWCDWDAEMAFPMVRWRRSEQERTRERKRMERRLRRLRQRVAEREEQEEEETAADAERREREDRQLEQLVALLRSLNQMPTAERRLTQSQAQSAAAEQRRQAATDESEANVCHFTPTLDYHAWSSIVLKFKLTQAKIPPMTDEEERRLRERMDKRARRKKEAKREDGEEGEDEEEEEEEEKEADGMEEAEGEEEKEDEDDG